MSLVYIVIWAVAIVCAINAYKAVMATNQTIGEITERLQHIEEQLTATKSKKEK